MASKKLDIVSLIESSNSSSIEEFDDITLSKIKENFTSEEEQLFVASFKCYTKYNSRIDFIVDFSKIWKWLGYSRIEECKRVLLKHFKENLDFIIEKISKINFPQIGGEKNEEEREIENNKETRGRQADFILLTINCFKKLCLKSRTEKADKIHDYYIKLEDTIFQVMKEKTNLLMHQLQIKDQEIENIALKNENNLLLKHNKKRCFYLINIDEKIIKFGITSDIVKRLNDHKRDISQNIILVYVLETVYNEVIEKKIKELCNNENDILYRKRLSIEYNEKIQTELINLDNLFTIEQLWNKVLSIEKTLNKDEIFIQMENDIKNLNNRLITKIDNDDIDGEYIYILSTNTVNQYIIDLTNNSEKSNDIYKTLNAKISKNLAYVLLSAYRVNENTFELPYNTIKESVEYCIMTYDHYKINKNDNYRFNYIQRYVSRFQEDKMIIQDSKELIKKNVYEKYIEDRIEYGTTYKVAVLMLYEDINKWYIEKYPDSKIDLHSILEKDLKEDIVRNFIKITGIEKTVINTYDKNNNKKYSSYPGFIGFRIKEETKDTLYTDSVYEEFISKTVQYTGNNKDRVFRSQLMDMFVNYVIKNYKVHPDTKGISRYKLIFMNEFNSMFKKFLNVDYNSELRSSANKLNLHGGFACCKMINYDT